MKLFILSLFSVSLLSSCTMVDRPTSPTSGVVIGNQITSGSTQFVQPVSASGFRN